MRRPKRDGNHSAVVQWYRDLGCSVAETHAAGLGVPDLFVGCVGLCDPVEIKTEEGRLLLSQENFISQWRGTIVKIVRSQTDVIDHVIEMRNRNRKP